MRRVLLCLLALSAPLYARADDAPLRLDQIQVIGSHNSYHAGLAPSIKTLLESTAPSVAQGLDYSHPPLPVQFDRGIRQIELDLYADSKGGLFTHPKSAAWLKKAGLPPVPVFDQAAMEKPGIKVMHVPDIDQHVTCEPLTRCLGQIAQWSRQHPSHVPIFVILEIVQTPPRDDFTKPETFTAQTYDELDGDIRSVFKPGELLSPDQVRGSFTTLHQAISTRGWPTVNSARGKIVFLLDQRSNGPLYRQGHAGLRGRVAFTNAAPGDEDAAFTELNDGPPDAIRQLVKQHMLVRTRADADTVQARTGDTKRRDQMLASGAQLISTDYPDSEPASWTGYHVGFLSGFPARCNPVTAPTGCTDAQFSTGRTVRRVVLLVRHGVRSPLDNQTALTAETGLEWPTWSGPSGDLTQHGAMLEQRDGTYLRHYIGELSLIPQTGCPAPGTVALMANSAQRTIASAEALANGLAPGCHIQIAHRPQGVPDPLFEPLLAHPLSDVRPLLTSASSRGGHFGPALDLLRHKLGCPETPVCERFETPSMLAASADHHGAGVAGTLDVAGNLAETLMLPYLDNKDAAQSGWSSLTETDFKTLSTLHGAMIDVASGVAPFAKAASAPIRAAMLAALSAPDAPPVTLFMAHDDTIENVLANMGLHVNAKGFGTDDIPPGSMLGFVESENTAHQDRQVQIVFLSRTPASMRSGTGDPAAVILQPTGCDGALCPVARLQTLLAN